MNDGVRIDVEVVAFIWLGALVVLVYRLPHDAREALFVPAEEAEEYRISPTEQMLNRVSMRTYEGTPMLG